MQMTTTFTEGGAQSPTLGMRVSPPHFPLTQTPDWNGSIFLMCISFSLIVHQLLLHLVKISRITDFLNLLIVLIFSRNKPHSFLLLIFFLNFKNNNLVNYCFVEKILNTPEIASWALYMSPGDNTAVMNSETKRTKRGRLKQEAQHRYLFATPRYHRWPCL